MILNLLKKYGVIVLGFILAMVFLKKCEQEPEVIIKTETKYVQKHDTIIKTIISEPEKIYITKTITKKGKDSIIYVKKEDSSAIAVNKYNTTIKSNNASADISIVSSGEVLDVFGVIHYKEKETIVNTFKTTNKSGVFLFVESELSKTPERFAVGVDWQIKNKILLGASLDYNDLTQSANFNIKVGLRIL
jgi:hypothetical protein